MQKDHKIAFEIKNAIGYISFIDPPENRMNSKFFDELSETLQQIIGNNKMKALIIEGKGRHFSSGADLDELINHLNKTGSPVLHHNVDLFTQIFELNIPVIASISGVCLGAAFELALHCHFRICKEGAIVGLPETSFDLIPGIAGIPKMMDTIGVAKTIEIVLKGSPINAYDAFEYGIVDAVFPKHKFDGKLHGLLNYTTINYRKYNKSDYLKGILDQNPVTPGD